MMAVNGVLLLLLAVMLCGFAEHPLLTFIIFWLAVYGAGMCTLWVTTPRCLR